MSQKEFRRLFRYHAIRPIKNQVRRKKTLQFSGKLTPFLSDLQSVDDSSNANPIAKDLVDRSPYYQNSDPMQSDYWPFILGMKVIYSMADEQNISKIRDAVKKRLTNAGATKGQLAQLVEGHRHIWDLYFASLFTPNRPVVMRAALVDCLRAVEIISDIDKFDNVQDLRALALASPEVPEWIVRLINGKMRRRFPYVAGVSDLLVVKERWLSYERGEIAHIENIMATENRTRTRRQFDSTSITTTVESERFEETEKSTEESVHNSMTSEVEETLATATNLATGVTASASFGPAVKVDTTASFDFSTTSEETRASSEEYAQDVVERAVSKVSTLERNETVTVVLSEDEDTRVQVFDNTAADSENKTGVYRYLDQLWEAQVFNYGKRLMLDIVVPEPSEQWKRSRQDGIIPDDKLIAPVLFNVNLSTITTLNYEYLAEKYQANVPPPPDTFYYVSAAMQLDIPKNGLSDDSSVVFKTGQISVPDDYAAIEVRGKFVAETWKDNQDKRSANLVIGGKQAGLDSQVAELELIRTVGVVEYGVYLDKMQGGVVSLRLKCEILPEVFAQWKIDVFKACLDASNRAWSEYEAAHKSKETIKALKQENMHPTKKRVIEKIELKRSTISLLAEDNLEDESSLVYDPHYSIYPSIDFSKAKENGDFTRFFEEAFEWDELTYLYYPYFWGRRDEWYATMNQSDPDVLFENFLQAGAARVNLAIRPGFEGAVLWYMATGQIWMGGPAPVIGDPLYVALIDEIVESKGLSLENPKKVGKSWTYPLPTSFVVLDPDDKLIPPPTEPAN